MAMVAIAGCASKEYYHISSKDHWSGYGSSCGGPLAIYKKRLVSGVSLQLTPERSANGTYLRLKILSEPGISVTLKSKTLGVTSSPDTEQEIRILPKGLKMFSKIKIASSQTDWFRVTLPEFEVNGNLTKIEPIEFEYKSGNYLMCLQ